MKSVLSKYVRWDVLSEQLIAAIPTLRESDLDLVLEQLEDKSFRQTLVVPDGTDMNAVQAIITAHDPAQTSSAESLRSQVIAILQSAVGLNVTALTVAQRNSVLVAMAYKLGALDKNLVVQPPEKWL